MPFYKPALDGTLTENGKDVHRRVCGNILALREAFAKLETDDDLLELAEIYLAFCIRHGQTPRVSELAAAIGLSAVKLSRAFSRQQKQGVARYLKKRQVDHAIALLRTTDLPLAAIARRSGFGCLRSFHRTFRRFATRPPSTFRTLSRRTRTPLHLV